MGLDLGEKTIGIAISDIMGITAQAKGVIRRKNLDEDLEELKSYISKYQIERIIMGLPVNMNGTSGERVIKTEEFANTLKKKFKMPILFWDERLSTIAAERILIDADISRSKRKKVIDKLAASIILQAYLDFENNKRHKEENLNG
jgi:putative holliday junction resolvase